MNNYVKIFSKPMGVLSYFKKCFNYGSQFVQGTWVIWGLFGSSEDVTLKGQVLIGPEEEDGTGGGA